MYTRPRRGAGATQLLGTPTPGAASRPLTTCLRRCGLGCAGPARGTGQAGGVFDGDMYQEAEEQGGGRRDDKTAKKTRKKQDTGTGKLQCLQRY